jgi:uncharacterized membrane protein YvbJ
MFCGECGTQNPDTNSFCKNCGKPLRKAGAAAPAPSAPVVQAQPVLQQPAGAPAVQPAATIKTSWPLAKKLAVVSIICGIGAFIVIPYILGILGIIIGAVSLKDRYYPAAAGILISIGAMLLNYLYIFIF